MPGGMAQRLNQVRNSFLFSKRAGVKRRVQPHIIVWTLQEWQRAGHSGRIFAVFQDCEALADEIDIAGLKVGDVVGGWNQSGTRAFNEAGEKGALRNR